MDTCVELKFCEACGSLFTRSLTDKKPYCSGCTEWLKDFPTPESRKRRGRPCRKNKMLRQLEVQA